MPVINATIDGVAVEIEEGCTGTQYYESRSDVVAMTVDGNAWDLSREIPAGATVEAITLNSRAASRSCVTPALTLWRRRSKRSSPM